MSDTSLSELRRFMGVYIW